MSQNNQNASQALANFQELQKLASQLGKDLDSLNLGPTVSQAQEVYNYLILWRDEFKLVSEGAYDAAGAFNSIVSEMTKGNAALIKTKASYSSLTSIAEKLLAHEAGINTLSTEQARKLKTKIDLEKQNLSFATSIISEKLEELEIKKQSISAGTKEFQDLEKQINILKDRKALNLANISETTESMASLQAQQERVEKSAKKIEEAYSLGGASLSGMQELMTKMGGSKLSSALGLDDAKEAMSRKALEVTDNGRVDSGLMGKMAVMTEGLSSVFTNLIKAIPQLLAAFLALKVVGTIIELFTQWDKSSGDLAKSMNMTYKEAVNVRSEFGRITKESRLQGVNIESLQKSHIELNSILSINAQINEDTLATMTSMRERAGLTTEEMRGALGINLATGDSLKNITEEILAQSQVSSTKLGVVLNEKEVLKDISKVSTATTLSLGKNPKLIADAVATTKALGYEMSKIEGMMDNMLDFESSIENELQAELLVGKNINLETARWAALNNDVATFAKEINNQVGSSEGFAKMNRIQQESIAKSVGMNREELAKTLFIQEQLVGVSKESIKGKEAELNAVIAKYGVEKATDALKEGKLDALLDQASASEDISQMIDEIKATVAPMMKEMLPSIKDAIKAVVEFMTSPAFLGSLEAIFKILSFVSYLIPKSKENLIGGLVGGPIGMVAGNITSDNKQKAQDGIAPSSKGPFTITDRFGATAVTAVGDHMVVSPNVSTSKSNNDNNRMQVPVQQIQNNDMKETNRLLSALISKQGEVRIDSTKMGTAIGMNTYSIQ